MNPADKQQSAEFLRWIGETQGIGPDAARSLCAFFYGRTVELTLPPFGAYPLEIT